jgi:hypothetical protein
MNVIFLSWYSIQIFLKPNQFMKKLLLSLFLFISILSISFAQQRPQRGSFNQGQGQDQIQERNMGASIGLIKYELKEVVKKVKIEDETKLADMSAYLETYNTRIDSLTTLNQPLFDLMRQQIRSARQSRDVSQMRIIRQENRQKLAPIKEEAELIQAELDQQLQPMLNKKQLKKWENYKASKQPVEQNPGGRPRNE